MKKILFIISILLSSNIYAAEINAPCDGKLYTRTPVDIIVNDANSCPYGYISVGSLPQGVLGSGSEFAQKLFYYMYVPKGMEFEDTTGTWEYDEACTTFN